MTDPEYDDNDTSDYLNNGEVAQLDLGNLFSSRFSNITLLYASPTGPCEIYSATRYGKRFILKALKKEYRQEPINNIALAKEFEIGISLEHPNIRRTFGLEEVEGLGKAIVLEYVDGCSLASMLESGRLSRSAGRSVMAQVADALSYIHTKQVFHRDLKPSNILISHQGNTVKIIDFNLSDSDAFVVLKNPAGSKKYMAPELLHPGAKPTAIADIYSFGVIMDEVAYATDDEQLANVAEKCKNSDPTKRPQSTSLIKLPPLHQSFAQSLASILSSKALTWILVAICIALSIFIVFSIINPN